MEGLDDDQVQVRLRIQQEVNEELGRTFRPEIEGDWEPWDDDVDKAVRLMKRIDIVLDYAHVEPEEGDSAD